MSPCLIERDHRTEDLIGILTSEDQRYLTEGFIVTENGRYVGMGSSEQLVRSVTEARIELFLPLSQFGASKDQAGMVQRCPRAHGCLKMAWAASSSPWALWVEK